MSRTLTSGYGITITKDDGAYALCVVEDNNGENTVDFRPVESHGKMWPIMLESEEKAQHVLDDLRDSVGDMFNDARVIFLNTHELN